MSENTKASIRSAHLYGGGRAAGKTTLVEAATAGYEPSKTPLCIRCGKYPAAVIKGRTFKLCAVCGWAALERLFDEIVEEDEDGEATNER